MKKNIIAPVYCIQLPKGHIKIIDGIALVTATKKTAAKPVTK